eukprot:GHVO01064330.1.p1 GENE.GHVO01064330.1~~GHVO01064330.1.p1  ORF type:complete len:147 (-),score=21.09 GHVO01064330.1:210-650(-)
MKVTCLILMAATALAKSQSKKDVASTLHKLKSKKAVEAASSTCWAMDRHEWGEADCSVCEDVQGTQCASQGWTPCHDTREECCASAGAGCSDECWAMEEWNWGVADCVICAEVEGDKCTSQQWTQCHGSKEKCCSEEPGSGCKEGQ